MGTTKTGYGRVQLGTAASSSSRNGCLHAMPGRLPGGGGGGVRQARNASEAGAALTCCESSEALEVEQPALHPALYQEGCLREKSVHT